MLLNKIIIFLNLFLKNYLDLNQFIIFINIYIFICIIFLYYSNIKKKI